MITTLIAVNARQVGVNLPQNMTLLILGQLRRPLRLSAMALGVVCRHLSYLRNLVSRKGNDSMRIGIGW